MEVEIKVIAKEKILLEQLDDCFLGEPKVFLLYFEDDAYFKCVEKNAPSKSCTIFHKEIEHEAFRKQK